MGKKDLNLKFALITTSVVATIFWIINNFILSSTEYRINYIGYIYLGIYFLAALWIKKFKTLFREIYETPLTLIFLFLMPLSAGVIIWRSIESVLIIYLLFGLVLTLSCGVVCILGYRYTLRYSYKIRYSYLNFVSAVLFTALSAGLFSGLNGGLGYGLVKGDLTIIISSGISVIILVVFFYYIIYKNLGTKFSGLEDS